jgi:hypothetical protein
MLWIAFLVGLFIGANVGIVVAGMLFSAKNRDPVPSRIANEHHVYFGAR